MRCPYCTNMETVVKDSRTTEEGKVVRRRRQCTECGGRYTTFERLQLRELVVVKRSGYKRPFDRNKILHSIATAMRKRNFDDAKIEEITNNVVLQIESSTSKEIPTRKIGNLIMKELAKNDLVAYIRFASVYKDFADAQDFAKFINKIKHH